MSASLGCDSSRSAAAAMSGPTGGTHIVDVLGDRAFAPRAAPRWRSSIVVTFFVPTAETDTLQERIGAPVGWTACAPTDGAAAVFRSEGRDDRERRGVGAPGDVDRASPAVDRSVNDDMAPRDGWGLTSFVRPEGVCKAQTKRPDHSVIPERGEDLPGRSGKRSLSLRPRMTI
jgi:hypothetical protein